MYTSINLVKRLNSIKRKARLGASYLKGIRMKWVDYYKCDDCSKVWEHEWDTEDYNNDYTFCPECGSVDFEEID